MRELPIPKTSILRGAAVMVRITCLGTEFDANLLPLDHPLFLLLAEPRRMQFTLNDGVWVRLIDVGGSLSARSYSGGDEIVLEVSDDLFPENAVAFFVRRAADGVPHHRYLEPALQQITEMGLDAEISGRTGHDQKHHATGFLELGHELLNRVGSDNGFACRSTC